MRAKEDYASGATRNQHRLWKGLLAPKKGAYAVILSVAKDLSPKANQQIKEILRFAQNDRLILFRAAPLSATGSI
jgi:hypothetical protein